MNTPYSYRTPSYMNLISLFCCNPLPVWVSAPIENRLCSIIISINNNTYGTETIFVSCLTPNVTFCPLTVHFWMLWHNLPLWILRCRIRLPEEVTVPIALNLISKVARKSASWISYHYFLLSLFTESVIFYHYEVTQLQKYKHKIVCYTFTEHLKKESPTRWESPFIIAFLTPI